MTTPLPAPQRPWPALVEAARARTPARVLRGAATSAYGTGVQLELRGDHAAAIDAVWTEFDLSALDSALVQRSGLFLVETQAATKQEFLLRPDLGRRFTAAAAEQIAARCRRGADVQLVLGDGLSATALATQAPELLPRLHAEFEGRGWTQGQPFVVRHARVGLLNEIGELLDPSVVVLLIGERPGLATAESLSAYLAYRPRFGHTDAQRNLISNIHARGVTPADAAGRIAELAAKLRAAQASGVSVKEDLPQLG